MRIKCRKCCEITSIDGKQQVLFIDTEDPKWQDIYYNGKKIGCRAK